LLQQEAKEIKRGVVSTLDDVVSHTVLITTGLELEEQQRRLQFDLSGSGLHPTDAQLAKVQERKNSLQRKIDNWCIVQTLYLPGLAMLRRTSSGPSEDRPQDIALWLPSAISGKISCDTRLYSHEWDLRHAQANDALHDLRRNLQLRSYLFKYKDRFATGQVANTRANTTVSLAQQHINASVARYRVSRKALLSLAVQLKKGDSWQTALPDLRDEDIRGMTMGEEGETEGRRTLSWIWKRGGVSGGEDSDLHECKSKSFSVHYY
jgi:hypothetical protein